MAVLAFVLIVMAAGLTPQWGLALPARTGAAPDMTRAATVGFRYGDDWRHLGQVIVYYRGYVAKRPLVYLLGGSAARECTTSDASWRRGIVGQGGPATLAFNLGSSGQSYDHDITIIEQLPQKPSIVFIGVNLGRYTHGAPDGSSDRVAGAIHLAEQADKHVITPYAQHRFTAAHILSAEQKRALVTTWLTERYPVFRRQFAYNAARLRALVAACQARGFHPVLLNLPLNQTIIGHRLDKPRARYAADCRAIAAELGVPYVDWLPHIKLVNSDFIDNWHLVEPGRAKWQRRMTKFTLTLLKRYHMLPQAEPSPSASPSMSPSSPSPEPTTPPATSP
jgi:hypothetical protein